MSLDIVMGPMFAGKSSHILDLVSRYTSIGTRVLLLKHSADRRYAYSDTDVVTHSGRRATCVDTSNLRDPAVITAIHEHPIVIVDEAQFFTGLREFCIHVVDEHRKKLYLVGLDGDSERGVFGELLDCIPLADRVTKLHGFCRRCANGTPGVFTHRKTGPHDQQMIVGGQDMYETLCRECYQVADVE